MQRYLRNEDRLIRIGGDEFLILLPNCNMQQGNEIIEQIKSAETKLRLQELVIGTSYGSCVANNEEELKQAIETADQEMYINKRKGKKL